MKGTVMSTNYLKDTFFKDEAHRKRVEEAMDSVMDSGSDTVEDEVRDKQ